MRELVFPTIRVGVRLQVKTEKEGCFSYLSDLSTIECHIFFLETEGIFRILTVAFKGVMEFVQRCECRREMLNAVVKLVEIAMFDIGQ